MPDLLTSKLALRKVLGIANKQATGQLEVETNIATVGDAATRSIVRLHNVDDATNFEYFQFGASGTNGYFLAALKGGTGSYRNFSFQNGGGTAFTIDAGGVCNFTANPIRIWDNIALLYNPAFSAAYRIRTGAIAADRDVTLPVLTGNDMFVFEDHAQDLENKTFKPTAASSGIIVPIKPSYTTVGDTTTRAALKIHNVDDVTNDEFLEIKSEGTNGYVLDINKAGTGSARALRLRWLGANVWTFDSAGNLSTPAFADFRDARFRIYNPGVTFLYTFRTSAITATREITFPLLTENDEFVFEKHHVPLISPEQQLNGLATPSVSTTAGTLMFLGGVLNGMTSTAGGTSTHTLDATEGMVSNFVSAATANVNCGLTTAAAANNITTANFNPVLRARFKIDSITASRVWIGFTGLPVAVSDTPMASGTAGVLFGYIVSGSTFIVLSNDTSGAATSTTMTAIAPDTAWHTVTISATGSQVQVVLDDGAGAKTQTITTAASRPAGTDSLGVVCTGQTSTTTAKTFSLKFCSFRADK